MKRLVPFALLSAFAASAAAQEAGRHDLDARNWVARRLTADRHVQLEVGAVERDGDVCRVSGTLMRVFSGPGKTGDGVAFRLPCGPQAFQTEEDLKSAKVLEVDLKAGAAGLEAPDEGQGLRRLEAPTDTPTFADDPALVREMSESLARYRIDTEVKRRDAGAALALARVDDPVLRARLLAHAAGLMQVRGLPEASAAAQEAIAAVKVLPAAERLEHGLAALESLAMGQVKAETLALAAELEPEIDSEPLPSTRDAHTLVLYGARIRAGDPASALSSLSKLSDPATRRDRLDNMPFAQKDFSPVNPQSPPWMDRLLSGAEALPPGEFREEARTRLARTAHRSALEMARMAGLLDKAAVMAEVGARHRHAPSAQLLALIMEAKGGASARARAARRHAESASGFDGGAKARAEALRALATFTPAERLAAARLLDQGAKGVWSPERLVSLAAR